MPFAEIFQAEDIEQFIFYTLKSVDSEYLDDIYQRLMMDNVEMPFNLQDIDPSQPGGSTEKDPKKDPKAEWEEKQAQFFDLITGGYGLPKTEEGA